MKSNKKFKEMNVKERHISLFNRMKNIVFRAGPRTAIRKKYLLKMTTLDVPYDIWECALLEAEKISDKKVEKIALVETSKRAKSWNELIAVYSKAGARTLIKRTMFNKIKEYDAKYDANPEQLEKAWAIDEPKNNNFKKYILRRMVDQVQDDVDLL